MKRKVISYLYEHLKTNIPCNQIENKYQLSFQQLEAIFQQLIQDGFLITYSSDCCYLQSPIARLNEQAIKFYLKNDYSICIFESLDSTNSYAKRNTFSKNALIVTNHQTAGRGRGSHSFYSPKDSGIYMSLVFYKKLIFLEDYQYPIIACVAVYKALQELFDISILIKWVNDLYYHDAKVGGILVEKSDQQLIIGIGLNIFNDLDLLQKNTREDVSSLQLYSVSRNEIIACIVKHIENLCASSWQSILTLYKQQSCLINTFIYYQANHQTFYGKVLDIDELGQLVVLVNNQIQHLHSGEVHIGSIKK